MTDGDFDAEEHRQWRKTRRWWNCSTDLIIATLVVLATSTVKRHRRKRR